MRSVELGCGFAGLALWWWLGGVLGLVVAGVVAIGGPRLVRRLDDRSAQEEQAVAAQLPLALDLLGACLAGGGSLGPALTSVAVAMGGPCGARLTRVAAALRVGTPPDQAFRELGASGAAGSAARALSRAAQGGMPVAAAVSRVAAQCRREGLVAARKRAKRAGIQAAAPLTMCFLPGFLVLGMVPTVASVMGPLLASL